MNTRYIYRILPMLLCFSFTNTFSQELDQEVLSGLTIEQLMKIKIATRTERTQAEISSTVYVYTAKDIKEHGWNSLTELVQDIPGVDIVNNGTGFYLSARGVVNLSVQGNKMVIMVDGHNMAFSSTNSPGKISVYNHFNIRSAKRVEVLVGPGSTLHGANAFGIIIDIITKDVEDIDGAELNIQIGTNEEYVPSFNIGKRFGKWGFFQSGIYWRQNKWNQAEVTISGADGNDVVYNNDTFEDNFTENYTVQGYVDYNDQVLFGYHLSRIDAGFGTFFVSEEQGRKAIDQYMIYLDINKQLSTRFKYTLRSHYKETAIDENEFVGVQGIVNRQVVLNMSSNSLVLDNQLTYEQNNRLTWLGGFFFEFSKQRPLAVAGQPVGTEPRTIPAALPKQNWNNYAAYFQTEWKPLDRLNFIAGLRYVASEEQYEDELLPRFGANYSITKDWNLKFNFQKGYRPPSALENGPSRGHFLRNPDLKSEKIFAYEVTLDARPTRVVNFWTTAYFSDVYNLIQRVNTDSVDQEGIPFGADMNAGEIEANGVELGVKYSLNKKFMFKGIFNYTNSIDCSINHVMQTVIPYKFNFLFHIRPLNNWKITLANYWRWRPNTNPTNTVFQGQPAPDWYLSNLYILYNAFSVKKLSFSLSIRNLFNQEYGHVDNRETSIYQTAYHPQERLNALMGVNYQL